MKIILLYFISLFVFSETLTVIQADKVFLNEIPEKLIPKMIENPLIEKKYKIEELNLKVGDEVFFKNRDVVNHNVSGFIGDENIFNVEIQEPGKKNDKKIKMSKPGIYRIQCAIHPKMLLMINVEE